MLSPWSAGRFSLVLAPALVGWWKRQAARLGHVRTPSTEDDDVRAGHTNVWRMRHCSPRAQYPRRNDWQTGAAGSTLTCR
eukprot:CAMPEP_0198691806 /NCGR_PEP_ID=MMETSP1468-20131203/212226_1 /TAXON_ID=1461545 /ORGANISM="Mantoniella sp, Strain CCMP1436" /LENGTH=79 /DNA_ID=CAMNT_0044445283 /DNA_START=426 /DNA_END=665 /DNA_ORIENTATION=-